MEMFLNAKVSSRKIFPTRTFFSLTLILNPYPIKGIFPGLTLMLSFIMLKNT